MFDIIIYFIALLITVPLAATWIVYKIALKIHKQRWRAIHTAVNWTTCLYIFAVIALLTIVFEKQLAAFVLIVLLSFFTCIIIIQWKLKTEVVFSKAFKGFWRFSFLFFSFCYVCLVCIGLVQEILS
ncbi:DUF3397 domain-containing protein [Virgibacillus oceani]|uniref:DUF3397 domain-containing protein n=1 Tax=Virgibacillus oceani TaxID=1479511 RepID=A0A917M131_9BACI|nr:DUF3397 domain-containing protein [Virgibacillus oceani]GGG69861.1 hypothetical protein GCM10011398_12340 [Virgibacillus oceani]